MKVKRNNSNNGNKNDIQNKRDEKERERKKFLNKGRHKKWRKGSKGWGKRDNKVKENRLRE